MRLHTFTTIFFVSGIVESCLRSGTKRRHIIRARSFIDKHGVSHMELLIVLILGIITENKISGIVLTSKEIITAAIRKVILSSTFLFSYGSRYQEVNTVV